MGSYALGTDVFHFEKERERGDRERERREREERGRKEREGEYLMHTHIERLSLWSLGIFFIPKSEHIFFLIKPSRQPNMFVRFHAINNFWSPCQLSKLTFFHALKQQLKQQPCVLINTTIYYSCHCWWAKHRVSHWNQSDTDVTWLQNQLKTFGHAAFWSTATSFLLTFVMFPYKCKNFHLASKKQKG